MFWGFSGFKGAPCVQVKGGFQIGVIRDSRVYAYSMGVVQVGYGLLYIGVVWLNTGLYWIVRY